MLPNDFFSKSRTLSLCKKTAQYYKIPNRGNKTPTFNQSKYLWIDKTRKSGTAMENKSVEQDLI